MGTSTKIEWSDHTFNIVWGCTKVSEACVGCYAERLALRYGFDVWGGNAQRRVLSDAYWRQPLTWERAAAKAGVRRRVFCSSMADVFEDHPTVAQERLKLWPLIERTPNLDWLLLTKRPENMLRMAPWAGRWPHNVWAMATVETQQRLDQRWPHLRQVPSVVLGLSMEPLLSAMDLSMVFREKPKDSELWIIAGGMSGPKVTEAPEGWFLSVRDQCVEAGVAFHFKQWGVRHINGKRVSKTDAGRSLNGREWDGLPK